MMRSCHLLCTLDPLAPVMRWDHVLGAIVIALGIGLLAFAVLRLPNRNVRTSRRLWRALARHAGISRAERRTWLAAARVAGIRSPSAMLLSTGCREFVLNAAGRHSASLRAADAAPVWPGVQSSAPVYSARAQPGTMRAASDRNAIQPTASPRVSPATGNDAPARR